MSFYQTLDPATELDFVFVHGDHSKKGAKSNFLLVRDKARRIAFHDIVNFKTTGAIDAWNELKENDGDAFELGNPIANCSISVLLSKNQIELN